MSDSATYRKLADDIVKLAVDFDDAAERDVLVATAAAWMNLAEHIDRQALKPEAA